MGCAKEGRWDVTVSRKRERHLQRHGGMNQSRALDELLDPKTGRCWLERETEGRSGGPLKARLRGIELVGTPDGRMGGTDMTRFEV